MFIMGDKTMEKLITTGNRRLVYSPSFWETTGYTGEIISVLLEPDEEVEWLCTFTADGNYYVSGYVIRERGCIKRLVNR